MRLPSPHIAKLAALLATPVAVVCAGGLIFQGSSEAFSATTRNAGNDWSTGKVALTNDSAGSARFQVANMLPGQTDTRCVTVTANTSVAGTIKGYAVNPVTSTTGLENHIMVSADAGTGGSFADCTGFTKVSTEFAATPLSAIQQVNSYASGFGGWNVTPGSSTRTYKITWTFDTTGMTQDQLNGLQGSHAGLDFQWELQSS